MKAIDPDARIIFVSNHTDERTRRAASAAGGIAFFGKDDLLSLLAFLAKQ
jgi:DNA-binding NarL/FixJ family response regulator